MTATIACLGFVPTPNEFGAGSSIMAKRGGGIPAAIARPSSRLRTSRCESSAITVAPVSASTRPSSSRRLDGMRTSAVKKPMTKATAQMPPIP